MSRIVVAEVRQHLVPQFERTVHAHGALAPGLREQVVLDQVYRRQWHSAVVQGLEEDERVGVVCHLDLHEYGLLNCFAHAQRGLDEIDAIRLGQLADRTAEVVEAPGDSAHREIWLPAEVHHLEAGVRKDRAVVIAIVALDLRRHARLTVIQAGRLCRRKGAPRLSTTVN